MANIDKVKLEQIIDKYLENEIPLSYLMETFDLTYPQMKLLINRATSYTRKTEKLRSNYQLSQDYIAIPHEIKEEYPLPKENQMSLLSRLDELKNLVPAVGKDELNYLNEELTKCKEALQSFNMDEIAIAEKVALDIDKMEENQEDFEDILRKNFLTPKAFQHLSQVYINYLQLQTKYSDLQSKKKESKAIKREIEDIKTTLVIHNMKLVNFCIRYFFSGILLPQDEIQLYGVEGLVKAINGFDPKLGFQFSTYAVPVIVHTIEHNFKNLTGLEWKDFCRKEQIRYYRKLYSEVTGDNKIEIDAAMLANSGLISLTEKEIKDSDKLIDVVVPLSEVQEPFQDETEYSRLEFPTTFEEYDALDAYIDKTEIGLNTLESSFAFKYIEEILPGSLKMIKPRELQVLILRLGLEEGESRKLKEIAKLFNVSHGRIGQIYAKALQKIRNSKYNRETLKSLLEYINEVSVPASLAELPPIKSLKNKE